MPAPYRPDSRGEAHRPARRSEPPHTSDGPGPAAPEAHNPYQAPADDQTAPVAAQDGGHTLFLQPARRPWTVYLMAVWTIVGLDVYLRLLLRSLVSDPEAIRVGTAALLVAAVILCVKVVQLDKAALITFGVVGVLVALLAGLNLASALFLGEARQQAALLALLFGLPSALLAVPALRPRMRRLADHQRRYRRQQALQKVAARNARR